MITLDNYFQEAALVDFDEAPQALSNYHKYFFKVTGNGETLEPYHNNESIKRATDMYLQKLNIYVDGLDKKEPAKVAQEKKNTRRERKTNAKEKTTWKRKSETATARPKRKAVRKPVLKEEPAAIVIRKKSLEAQLIRRYMGMDGKIYKVRGLELLAHRIRKGLEIGTATEHHDLLRSIASHMEKAVKLAENENAEAIEITLNPETKAKAQEILKNLKVKVRFEYLAGTDEPKK